ncbi:hypothetical protein AHiyo1_10100 [Arthrobacter sp. Hiyo1]|nr:hypothetical protein AHiyo1_10100 [Arthrobacter sp. Hiyo1]
MRSQERRSRSAPRQSITVQRITPTGDVLAMMKIGVRIKALLLASQPTPIEPATMSNDPTNPWRIAVLAALAITVPCTGALESPSASG